MTKEEKTQALFQMILRIQNGCAPVVWSISDRNLREEDVVVTIEEASPRSVERLLQDQIRDLPLCFISVNKGKFEVRLG